MLDDEIVLSLSKRKKILTAKIEKKVEKKIFKPRQVLGQPASPGLATGKARIIENKKDLFDFKKGEILVIDSIDPNITFIVPLAAGIIERRGGMLIHGAIIAREYGIPCVTGIPSATNIIKDGDVVTIDGYLGIIIINQ
jgi:pyruvate,water dikinase